MLGCLFCDDDQDYLGLIYPVCETLVREQSMPVRMLGTAEGTNEAIVLRRHHDGSCLVFLDLDFGVGKLRGVDIARQLRKIPMTRIVYVTAHRESVMELLTSGTEPYGYLDKSMDFSRLADGMRKYLTMALRELPGRETKKGEEQILLHVAGEEIPVQLSDIVWLSAEKTMSHGITYHKSGGSVLTVIGTLEAERNRLEKVAEHPTSGVFYRIHRSFVVNRTHVAALRHGEVILSDGTRLPCSLSMRGEVQKWLARE